MTISLSDVTLTADPAPCARRWAHQGNDSKRGRGLPAGLLRTVLAAEAAGGIAATFNAPIPGVFFSLEVLLRDFSARAFSVLVLASVTATVISRALLGNAPAFSVPPYELVSAWELLFYAVLGILAAVVARGFSPLNSRMVNLRASGRASAEEPNSGRERWLGTRPVNTTPSDGADRSVEFREGEAASGAGCRAAGYASGAAWAALQWRGSSSARRRLEWEGIRSSTSRRYGHGSRPCALHVATRL